MMKLGEWGLGAPPTPGPRIHRWVLHGTTLLLCLCSGLALLGLPLETTAPKLDPSWVEAYVYFTKTDAQAGVDYMFTYGPLAHFIAAAYDPDLYTMDLVMGVLIAILLTVPLAWVALRRGSLVTALFLLWIVGILAPRYMGNEVGACMAIIAATMMLLEMPRKPPLVCGAIGVAFAFFSLLKFTMLVMCVASMGTLLLQWAFARRARAETPAWILALASAYGLGFMTLWVLSGQNPLNILAYLLRSVEISQAYVMGMHTPLDPQQFYIGLGIALLAAVQLCLLLPGSRAEKAVPRAVLFFACVSLLLAWKMGVARSQPPKFYVPAASIAVLLAAPWQGNLIRPRLRHVLPLLVVALATLGTLQVFGRNFSDQISWSITGLGLNAYRLTSPVEGRVEYEKIRDGFRRAYAYPEIRSIVGSDTVDMFTANQSIIFFNDMNYHPRPVFQGYQACSPGLARLNGDFYTSADAPKYVMRMAKLEAIDGRFPTTEDTEVLKALFTHYRPVHWERYFVLLERRDDPPAETSTAPGELRDGTARLHDWIPLENPGDQWQFLSLHLKPSIPGRLREFIFQPPMPLLEVRLSDGTVETSRINIGAIENGFIINPVFELVQSLDSWPGASSTRHVEAVRVTVAQGKDWVLQPDFTYSVRTVPPLVRAAN